MGLCLLWPGLTQHPLSVSATTFQYTRAMCTPRSLHLPFTASHQPNQLFSSSISTVISLCLGCYSKRHQRQDDTMDEGFSTLKNKALQNLLCQGYILVCRPSPSPALVTLSAHAITTTDPPPNTNIQQGFHFSEVTGDRQIDSTAQ